MSPALRNDRAKCPPHRWEGGPVCLDCGWTKGRDVAKRRRERDYRRGIRDASTASTVAQIARVALERERVDTGHLSVPRIIDAYARRCIDYEYARSHRSGDVIRALELEAHDLIAWWASQPLVAEAALLADFLHRITDPDALAIADRICMLAGSGKGEPK